MTKKKILIIGFVVLGVLVIVVSYFISRQAPGVTEQQQSSVQTGATIKLNGVVVNNFLGSAKQINKQGDSALVKTNNYELIYFPKNNSFLISILASPFERNRQLAEAELLRRLNISKEDACKLIIVTTTPAFVNANEAGQNFKLSFCK